MRKPHIIYLCAAVIGTSMSTTVLAAAGDLRCRVNFNNETVCVDQNGHEVSRTRENVNGDIATRWANGIITKCRQNVNQTTTCKDER